jgi:hypothetical protein
MFTPGIAIFHLAMFLRFNHVCGVEWIRVWRKSIDNLTTMLHSIAATASNIEALCTYEIAIFERILFIALGCCLKLRY